MSSDQAKIRLPKVGVGVIIVGRDGRVLARRRKNAHGSGTWGLVGGHLEWQETWEDCARREALEEAGLVIDNLVLAGVTNDIMHDDDNHYVTIFMRADHIDGDVQNLEPEVGDAWAWFAWEELPTPHFLPLERFYQTGYHPHKKSNPRLPDGQVKNQNDK